MGRKTGLIRPVQGCAGWVAATGRGNPSWGSRSVPNVIGRSATVEHNPHQTSTDDWCSRVRRSRREGASRDLRLRAAPFEYGALAKRHAFVTGQRIRGLCGSPDYGSDGSLGTRLPAEKSTDQTMNRPGWP